MNLSVNWNLWFRFFLVFSLLGGNSVTWVFANKNSLVPRSSNSSQNNSQNKNKIRVYTSDTYANAQELVDFKSGVTKADVEALKSILAEQGIVVKDKRSVLRFLRNFKKQLKSDAKGALPSDSQVLSPRTLNPIISHILDTYEKEYHLNIKRSHKKSIHYLDKVVSNPKASRKDTKFFRKSLSAIGLPSHAYSEQFIKEVILQNPEFEKVKENAHKESLTDKNLYEMSQNTKDFFDKRHYMNLKQQTQFLNILKGFPVQLIVFQAAIGATIFSKYFYDSYAYDAKTNPEPMGNFMEMLTPSAAFSFFVFIITSQYTQLGMYKLGIKWDSKMLKASAPQAGLAFGFFASAIFDEVLHDVDLHACVKQVMTPEKKAQEEVLSRGAQAYHDIAQTTPCEKSYMEWAENKWRDYAVDLAVLLGSSAISHKIIRTLTLLIRSHAAGEALLARMAMAYPRLASGAAFFVGIYLFMETYRVLDLHIGRHVKQKWALSEIWQNVAHLDSNLNSFSWGQNDESRFKKILKQIKSLGHRFARWPKVHGLEYETAFYQWNAKTNKILSSYELTHALLNQMYDKSQETLFDSFNPYNPEAENGMGLSRYINYEILQGVKRVEFVGVTCKSLANSNWLNETIPYWKSVCENSQEEMQTSVLGLDAKKIMVHYLRDINKGKQVSLGYVQNYLSNNPNELFKPFVINKLTIDQRFKLAETLLSIKDSSSIYNDDLKREARKGAQRVICKELEGEYEGECNVSKTYLDSSVPFLLSQKTTLAGLKLLKTTLKESRDFGRDFGREHSAISYVIKLFKPYGKGQEIFEALEQNLALAPESKSLKSLLEKKLSVYFVIDNLICGSHNDLLEDYFKPPKLFAELKPLCSQSEIKNGIVTDKLLNHYFKKNLISRSVSINGKEYESGYLALDSYVRDNFKSKEDLMQFFVSQSEQEMNYYSQSIVNSLNNLTDNFMVPGLVNSSSSVLGATKCSDIASYYTLPKSEEFKGLEISLFQIRFWADKLKELKELEGGDFDAKVYATHYCETMELLKSYHDNFITGAKTVTATPKETQSVVYNGVLDPNQNMIQVLKNQHEGKNMFVSHSVVFFSFLQKTYPDWMISIYLQDDSSILEDATPVQKIGYAVVKELEKSIQRYFEYLSVLRIKEGFNQGLVQATQTDPSLGL